MTIKNKNMIKTQSLISCQNERESSWKKKKSLKRKWKIFSLFGMAEKREHRQLLWEMWIDLYTCHPSSVPMNLILVVFRENKICQYSRLFFWQKQSKLFFFLYTNCMLLASGFGFASRSHCIINFSKLFYPRVNPSSRYSNFWIYGLSNSGSVFLEQC